jgi:hypothetical protein
VKVKVPLAPRVAFSGVSGCLKPGVTVMVATATGVVSVPLLSVAITWTVAAFSVR